MIQETIYGELRKSPVAENLLQQCWQKELKSIHSGQTLRNDWILFLNKQKPFLSLVFNQPRCHDNRAHHSQKCGNKYFFG